MVYMAAENTLSVKVAEDLREMVQGAGKMGEGDHLVIYVDDVSLPRIYALDKESSQAGMSQALVPVKEYKEDQNSASATTLVNFVKWAMRHYPAEDYGLVMWSHGSGWAPEPTRSICIDNGKGLGTGSAANIGAEMEITDMARALAPLPHLEFILFDACYMQTIEVCYELRNCTKWVIASPVEINADGGAYQELVAAMTARPFAPEKAVATYEKEYLDTNFGLVMSAVNTAALPPLAAFMKEKLALHREHLLTDSYDGVYNYFFYDNWRYSMKIPDQYDIRSLMRDILSENEFAEFETLLQDAVPVHAFSAKWYSTLPFYDATPRLHFHAISAEDCAGVAMSLPLDKYSKYNGEFLESYHTFAWSKAIDL